MEHTMDKPATLTLNQERLLDRGHKLAEKLAIRDSMVADEKRRRQAAKADLDEFDAQISKLAETIRAGFETVAQGDLFADQALATEALATVAEKACTCNPETPSIHDPGCAVHGVDAEPVQPGKLHKFRVSAKSPEECGVCGFDEGSGIHERHGYAQSWEEGSPDGACQFCPLPEGDEIHQAEPSACDGNHEPPACGDSQCWVDDPAEEGIEEADAHEPDLEEHDAAICDSIDQALGDVEGMAGPLPAGADRMADDEGGGPVGAEPEGVIDAIKREQEDRPRVLKHRRKAEAGA